MITATAPLLLRLDSLPSCDASTDQRCLAPRGMGAARVTVVVQHSGGRSKSWPVYIRAGHEP